MSRLIDADVLVKIIDKHTNDENQLDDDITCILEEIPTVEAVPVVHGEWVFVREGTYNSRRAYCSACGKRSGIGGIQENQMKPYCPNCGAKMKVVE